MVVRRRVSGEAGPTGGQAYTDVLGILEYWEEQTLAIRRADNSLVEIPIADVFRAKRVPPRPRRPREGDTVLRDSGQGEP